jgi:hypothetical protein
MDGKDYSLLKSKKQTDRNLMLKKQLDGLILAADNIARDLTPKDAFKSGLIMQSASKTDGTATRMLLLSQLERLVRAVNATRSFQSQSDLQDAVDDIQEIFPSLKVEEILLCFKYIRQGKYELYGNLTTNTLIKCLHNYEIEHTVPLREQKHREQQPYVNGMIDWKRLSDAIVLPKEKKTLEEAGGSVHLTLEDFNEIAKAQKEAYQAQNLSE